MPPKRRLKMGLLIAAAALIFGYGTAYVASDDVRYLSRAGLEETRILTKRVPISRLATDPKATPTLRAQAKLVLDVRAYATKIGLTAGETYTSYSDVGRDTLLLVLTASPKFCICAVTWSYPVAGKVPYKGFFDFGKAYKTVAEYAAKGFDVNLRPSAAFSTLGWFNDPLLSTALTADTLELATTVFHEIAHNTVWIKGATDFNESFAQWVAYHAAESFFLARNDTALSRRAAARWQDEQLLGRYYELLVGKLDSLYGLKLPPAQNDSGRTVVARWSRDTLTAGFGPLMRTYSVGGGAERPINNATLIGVRLYRTNLDLFEQWTRSNPSLPAAIDRMKRIMDGAVGPAAFVRMRNALTPLK